ncbi:hypothetical protein GCM10010964_40800 [Caldovatus sediminis]|uniref:Uncharacterized protein n=1 Tax=Caldovatus sediminis TaxID=2041189 RepID=A0A8J2ZEU5_9PROT|nr:hypothetical protein [Caldovatus sediminis]GGG49315.1 hypothetical protein GCM10010964_40800 [Caldovatus sediminis]
MRRLRRPLALLAALLLLLGGAALRVTHAFGVAAPPAGSAAAPERPAAAEDPHGACGAVRMVAGVIQVGDGACDPHGEGRARASACALACAAAEHLLGVSPPPRPVLARNAFGPAPPLVRAGHDPQPEPLPPRTA